LFGFGAVCGGYLGGRLSDKIGFYKVQMITLLGGGLLFIVLGQMRSYLSICIFTYLLSVINEAFRPANAAAVAQYSNEENRTRSYSLNRLAINLGWAVGSALGGLLATIDFHLLFWVDGITNMAAAGLMWYYLKPPSNAPAPHKKATVKNDELSAYRNRSYLIFIGLTILFAACFFQLFTNFSLFLNRDLGFSKLFIGFIMALNGIIIACVEMIIVFSLEGKKAPAYFISRGVLLTGFSFVLLNLLPPTHAMAVFVIILITFGEILAMPFMNTFWITQSAEHNRGQYAGLYTIAWSVAQTFGPFLGANVADHFGFYSLWWILGLICLVSSLGYLLLGRTVSA
jgi:predicted MFS family arabinose efflux permease